MGDYKYRKICIDLGLLKAVLHVLDRTKTKTEELMTEMMWSIYYLINYNEECAF